MLIYVYKVSKKLQKYKNTNIDKLKNKLNKYKNPKTNHKDTRTSVIPHMPFGKQALFQHIFHSSKKMYKGETRKRKKVRHERESERHEGERKRHGGESERSRLKGYAKARAK